MYYSPHSVSPAYVLMPDILVDSEGGPASEMTS